MHKNRLVVRAHHDYEDTVHDGMNFLHRVVSCDVGEEEGKLVYDIMRFPVLPVSHASDDPVPGPTISRKNPIIQHVSEKTIVGADVISLLRQRGVEVVILPEGVTQE
jgi:hypothetical protein